MFIRKGEEGGAAFSASYPKPYPHLMTGTQKQFRREMTILPGWIVCRFWKPGWVIATERGCSRSRNEEGTSQASRLDTTVLEEKHAASSWRLVLFSHLIRMLRRGQKVGKSNVEDRFQC